MQPPCCASLGRKRSPPSEVDVRLGHRCRNSRPEDQLSVVWNSQQNSRQARKVDRDSSYQPHGAERHPLRRVGAAYCLTFHLSAWIVSQLTSPSLCVWL